ncbi:hypothetical protein LEP1GSC128_1561 [Leptospira borgpetersenii str. 200801926]|uniref:SLEI domain protein, PF07620 family n=1 Tax=Leptospira borgpetersenii str. 200801926 TaxID=1193009 RepID=A0ABP2S8Q5_LEPBO|nr:hypothetical protein LEP1GSC128_1561 [Leptospira borgpetersenii str. 200801926]
MRFPSKTICAKFFILHTPIARKIFFLTENGSQQESNGA